jgi:hypothetical protein
LTLGYGKLTGRRPDLTPRALRAALDDEISNSGCETTVISSEGFILRRDATRVARFFEGTDIRIVVYLRRHDKWIESLIAQAIKTLHSPPWDLTMEGYMNHQRDTNGQYIGYRELLEHWSGAFGQDRIIVRPYEMQQNQPNLVADFLATIGHAGVEDGVPVESERHNPALSGRALMLIAQVNRTRLSDTTKRRITRMIVEEAPDLKGLPLFSPAARLAVIEQNRADYEWIARTFLDRDDGQLFHDALPAAEDPYEGLPQPGLPYTTGTFARILRNKVFGRP